MTTQYFRLRILETMGIKIRDSKGRFIKQEANHES